jgi:hypothetical protein
MWCADQIAFPGSAAKRSTLKCAKLIMKPWLRLLLVTVSVAGGFTGMGVVIANFANAHSAVQMTLWVVFLGLYGFVTISGLIFLYDPKRTRPLVAALALQIPWISSPVLVYQFAAGVLAAITLGTPEETDRIGVHLGGSLLFGAHFQFRLGSNVDVPISVGVNVVAVVLLVLLVRANGTYVQPPDLPMPIRDSSDSASA